MVDVTPPALVGGADRDGSISPFLKKRLMSRVFDGVEVRFLLGVVGAGVGVVARVSDHWPLPLDGQWVGGAVKAVPLGPPEGGALRAPGLGCRQPILGIRPPGRAVLDARGVGWAQRTSPLLNILSGATEMLGDRPFLRDVFAWCVPATVRTGSFK
jgi:hypothetical protein